MVRKTFLSLCFFSSLFIGYGTGVESQETPDLHVVVSLVQLNVAVTDKNGSYITGLKPTDFVVTEDGITEKVATFAEGNEPALSLIDSGGFQRIFRRESSEQGLFVAQLFSRAQLLGSRSQRLPSV